MATSGNLALTLLRQVRASGITATAVLGDAEFGESATLRRTLHRAQLPYTLGVSSTTHGLCRDSGPRGPGIPRRHGASALAPDAGRRCVGHVGADVGGGSAGARVARRVLAQWHAAGLARAPLRDPRHAGA